MPKKKRRERADHHAFGLPPKKRRKKNRDDSFSILANARKRPKYALCPYENGRRREK